jgi:hypothetical protein
LAGIYSVNRVLAKAGKAVVLEPAKVAIVRVTVANNKVDVAIIVKISCSKRADLVRSGRADSVRFGRSQIKDLNTIYEHSAFGTFSGASSIFKLDGSQLRVCSERQLVFGETRITRFHSPRLRAEGINLRVANNNTQSCTANSYVRTDHSRDALGAVEHPARLASRPNLQS